MALVVTVGGVDRTSSLVHETVSVSQSNDGLNSTCVFNLLDEDVVRQEVWTVGITRVEDPDPITDYVALAGTKVEVSIVDGGTTYFAGILSRVSATHLGSTEILGYITPETKVSRCECHDFNQLLEESVIDELEEYGAKTDEELIDDVFGKYVTDIDFATHVDGGAYVFDEIEFEGITVRQFLDTICAQSKCIWYVDYSKKLHYALAEDNAPAWHLSDTPDDVNSFEYFDDITQEIDATNLVNMVFVVGGPVSLWFVDADSRAKYGDHKAIVRDTGLVDIDDIEGKGNAILEKFKDPIVTYQVKTYKDGLRAGMHVRLVSAFYDVDKTFLINNLVITFPVDGNPVYEITCGGLDSSASSAAQRSIGDQIVDPTVPIDPWQLPIAALGWAHDLEFSAPDHETVEWSAGTITTAAGQEFAISAGNTDDPGAMVGVTYVYLDRAISETALQVTDAAEHTVGAGRILVAVCAPSGIPGPDPAEVFAMYQVFGGGTGTILFLHADNIAANCLTANEIAANSILTAHLVADAVTAAKIDVANLQAVSADMGVLTAGEIRMYAGVWDVNATGFRLNATEIAGQNTGVDQVVISAATGRLVAVNAHLTGDVFIGNPGDIDGSTINNDDGWTDDTAADAANAHRILGVTGTWTVTDADTITWTNVHLFLGDGSDVVINDSNTGNMAAKTYIYYNETANLQLTVDPDVIGLTHTLVAVAQNGATLANIQIVGGGTYISGDWINTGTITAAKISVANLEALSATMGTLTAGEIFMTGVAGSMVLGTGGIRFYDGDDPAMDNPVIILSTADGSFTLKSAMAGNPRIEINNAEIAGYDGADVLQFQLDAADGKAYFGGGAGILDQDGLRLVGAGGAGSARKVRFIDDSAGEKVLGFVRSEWGGGAAHANTWLAVYRIVGDPWPADVRVILAAIDVPAGGDTRWTVDSNGTIGGGGCSDFILHDGVRNFVDFTSPGHLVLQLADNAGAREFQIHDSDGAVRFYVDSDGEVLTPGTIAAGFGDHWKLGDYTAGVQVSTGYIDVNINGTGYRLLCRLP